MVVYQLLTNENVDPATAPVTGGFVRPPPAAGNVPDADALPTDEVILKVTVVPALITGRVGSTSMYIPLPGEVSNKVMPLITTVAPVTCAPVEEPSCKLTVPVVTVPEIVVTLAVT